MVAGGDGEWLLLLLLSLVWLRWVGESGEEGGGGEGEEDDGGEWMARHLCVPGRPTAFVDCRGRRRICTGRIALCSLDVWGTARALALRKGSYSSSGCLVGQVIVWEVNVHDRATTNKRGNAVAVEVSHWTPLASMLVAE